MEKIEKKYTTMMKKKHCEASVENRIKIGSVNQRNKKMIKSPQSKTHAHFRALQQVSKLFCQMSL